VSRFLVGAEPLSYKKNQNKIKKDKKVKRGMLPTRKPPQKNPNGQIGCGHSMEKIFQPKISVV